MSRVHDTESFIAKSRAKYDQQFGYQDAIYVDARTPLVLYCLHHSAAKKFEVTPDRHFRKKGGCRQCKADGARARHGKGRDGFIAEAQTIHGDAFDYGAVDYINAHIAVKIYCRRHERQFEQVPDVHLRGAGCPRCKGEKISLANEPLYASKRVLFPEFLTRARERHSDYYQYDEASYRGFNLDVTIICPEHGPFSQRAQRHAEGSDCKDCVSESLKLTEQDWRARIHDKFGSKLTVTIQTPWSGFATPTHAHCSVHDVHWSVKAQSLLVGNGCRECVRLQKNAPRLEALRNALPPNHAHLLNCENPNFLEFVIAADKKHSMRYQYAEAQFVSMSRYCEITCQLHGWTRMLPQAHLDGQGCNVCDYQRAFIANALALFGERNDYSRVAFQSTSAKEVITVRCVEHELVSSQSAEAHLRGSHFCPQCRAASRKLSTAERRQRNQPSLIQAFKLEAFQTHGGKYQYPALENELHTWVSKVTVFCPEHSFTFTPSAAAHVQQGRRSPAGCQRCKGDASRLRYRTPYQVLRTRLAEHGFTFLEQEEDYVNQSQKAFMRCNEGHEVYHVPQKIFSGRGCPDCSPFVGEAITRSVLDSVLRVSLRKKRFYQNDHPALVTPHAWLELDGYDATHQIAFEYQGAWHSQRQRHKSEASYREQLQRDAQKAVMCKALHIALIEVHEFEYPFQAVDVRHKLESALLKANLKRPWALPDPLPLQAHTPMLHAQGLKSLLDLAKAHNLTVKEKAWYGKHHHYTWTCNACEHVFKTSYALRLKAKWPQCPSCVTRNSTVRAQAHAAMRVHYPRHLESLRSKGQKLGLTLLDSEWRTTKPGVTYRFSCTHTNKEVAPRTYNNILKRVHGCRCEVHRQMRFE
ncbi:hypothetical protein ACEI36_01995 [Pseudomonas kielensis]|uniref:hypothetical protein n=1 Tax=Pseudomonas kielensis TaxID=2762577 RepID=UPI0038A2CBED